MRPCSAVGARQGARARAPRPCRPEARAAHPPQCSWAHAMRPSGPSSQHAAHMAGEGRRRPHAVRFTHVRRGGRRAWAAVRCSTRLHRAPPSRSADPCAALLPGPGAGAPSHLLPPLWPEGRELAVTWRPRVAAGALQMRGGHPQARAAHAAHRGAHVAAHDAVGKPERRREGVNTHRVPPTQQQRVGAW